MIEIKNVSKIYKINGETVKAVDNVSLRINKADIFGIMGLSGAGKSSLLKCINYLQRPDMGQIIIDNVDLSSLSEKRLRDIRKNMGMIFQNFNLFMNASVYDNVAFPLKICKFDKKKIDLRVDELLRIVDLYDKKDSYPSSLSGGQKQRVSIARALASDPKIILCDEATSALDPSTTDSILKLLKDINEKYKITIVLITHEMDVIKQICNNVAVMEGGSVVEYGPVNEVFTNPKSILAKKFLKERVI